MKKLFFLVVIAIISVSSFTSCTKEEVKPNAGGQVGGIANKE
jgi:hypothetical protein